MGSEENWTKMQTTGTVSNEPKLQTVIAVERHTKIQKQVKKKYQKRKARQVQQTVREDENTKPLYQYCKYANMTYGLWITCAISIVFNFHPLLPVWTRIILITVTILSAFAGQKPYFEAGRFAKSVQPEKITDQTVESLRRKALHRASLCGVAFFMLIGCSVFSMKAGNPPLGTPISVSSFSLILIAGVFLLSGLWFLSDPIRVDQVLNKNTDENLIEEATNVDSITELFDGKMSERLSALSERFALLPKADQKELKDRLYDIAAIYHNFVSEDTRDINMDRFTFLVDQVEALTERKISAINDGVTDQLIAAEKYYDELNPLNNPLNLQ